MRKAIAIDFDGCLCENAWPEIGAPNWAVIHAALEEQKRGTALILWTCRSGELLDHAVSWSKDRGLIFDAVNANLPERLERYQTESRKVSADEYWDDLAVRMPFPSNVPLTLKELREMDGEPVWNDTMKIWAIIDFFAQFGPRTIIREGRWRPIDDRYYRRKPEDCTRE